MRMRVPERTGNFDVHKKNSTRKARALGLSQRHESVEEVPFWRGTTAPLSPPPEPVRSAPAVDRKPRDLPALSNGFHMARLERLQNHPR